jgi:arginine/ornithine transport system substrate-binding protein
LVRLVLVSIVVHAVWIAGFEVAAQAQEQRPLRVGVDSNYPPLAYRREDGRLEGFDVDVAYALCAELGRHCELVPGLFADMIEWIRGGRVDIAVVSMSITDERERLIDFSIPYYRAPVRFIGRSDPAPPFGKGAPSGLTIGVREGTVFENYANSALDEENTVISYALQEEIYLDLVLGRLDLGLGNGLTMRTGFLNTQLGVGFEAVGPQLDDPAYFGRGEAIALRKAQSELRAATNAAIERLLSDGGLAEIWSRYFDIPPDTALAGAS